jgi:hypothetical protein
LTRNQFGQRQATQSAFAYGLCIESELQLNRAGFSAAEDIQRPGIRILQRNRSAVPDRRILLATATADHGADYRVLSLEGGKMCLMWDDGLELLITDGGKLVEVNNSTPHDIECMSSYIINFAFSGALLLQGEETLHGTVLDVDSLGVGLIGLSGAGKSTLGACLVSRGAKVVTDDIMRLEFENELVFVYYGPDRLKLFRDAWQSYLPDSPSSGLFHPVGDKELVIVPRAGDSRSASPLHILVYLDCNPDQAAEPSLEEVSGLDKFGLLAPSTMNTRYVGKGRSEQHFAFISDVARRLPLYRLRYRPSPEIVPGMARLILDLASRSLP